MVEPSLAPLSESERRILGYLFRKGLSTQGELTGTLGLAQQSVSRLVSGLIDKGIAASGDKIGGAKGYRTTAVRLAGDHAWSLGVSITAGMASIAIIDLAGTAVRQETRAFPSLTREALACWLEDVIAERVDAGAPAGVGVSVAGSFVSPGIFNTPRYLDDWAGVDVALLLSERLGLPVWADNDGNSAALAEAALGVGRWAPSLACLYLSAGVGGGIILDGEPWRGRVGNAGEFAGGLPPNIYAFPNLELLRLLVGKDGPVFETVGELIQGYDPSWSAIEDWIERVRDSVSIIVSNATAILDLDAIVLGGLTPPDLASRLGSRIELFDQRRRSIERPVAKVVASEVEGDAAAIGGAMLPLRATFFATAR